MSKPEWLRFWAQLSEKAPDLHYVRLAATCPRRDRRSDAQSVWELFKDDSRVIFDFEGVDDATPHFLLHLLFEESSLHFSTVLPINMSPTVKTKLEEAHRIHERTADLHTN